MKENSAAECEKRPTEFREEIHRKVERRLKSKREGDRSVWFGLGMFGVVGWTVALPALLGTALGWWIDTRWDTPFSWTLMGLFVGIAAGCLAAWRWVRRESEAD